ncbi:hypothetical protein [Lactococcus formosensis]|uniref:hypothetical protein n=1 Tax=Lactococcus formosensis TaxID=1281486 RepID=UPI003266422B
MEKLVNLWNNTFWFKILFIIIVGALSYWFGTLAIIVAMILAIYAIITIIRKYILKRPTRFKALYIFIIAITLTIVGGYGYAQTHPEEMAQTKLEQQKAKEDKKKAEDKKAEEDKKHSIEKASKDKAKAEQEAKAEKEAKDKAAKESEDKAEAEKKTKEKAEQEAKDKAQDDKNTTEDNHHDTNINNAFVEYLNNDLSKLDSSQVDSKTLLNSKTMKFESKNARTVFLMIPKDIKNLTKDNKQKLANNAQYIYQENYKSWSNKNKIKEKNPPMLMIKYVDSQVGDEMAVWIPGTNNIELR